jgi:hypothetical protein
MTEDKPERSLRSYSAHLKITLVIAIPMLAEHMGDARHMAERLANDHGLLLDGFDFEEAKADLEIEVVSVSSDPIPSEDQDARRYR